MNCTCPKRLELTKMILTVQNNFGLIEGQGKTRYEPDMKSKHQSSKVNLIFPWHFQADPKLLEAVEGLKPDPEKHQFYIDLQPVSYQT